MRHGEHYVEIGQSKQVFFARLKLALACLRLTLWAVSVTARVIGDSRVTASRAFIPVTAERHRTAALNGTEYFQLLIA
jgi:hypothetical protein